MHCINVMPRALRPGSDTGASILVGAKAPILDGAQMGSLTIPFMKMEPPFDEIKEFVEKMWDWWMEEGKNRERHRRTIQRQGLRIHRECSNWSPIPAWSEEPRSNPYIFWKEDEVEGGWTAISKNTERNIRGNREVTSMPYDPANPLKDRITDIGPQKYRNSYPLSSRRNYGKWLYHEILEPGVSVHVSPNPATKSFSVRVAPPA